MTGKYQTIPVKAYELTGLQEVVKNLDRHKNKYDSLTFTDGIEAAQREILSAIRIYLGYAIDEAEKLVTGELVKESN